MADEQEHRIRRPRNFRPRLDIFNVYDDSDFRKRYRVDQNGLMYVTDLIREAIANLTERSHAVTPEMKVALTLRYFATGKMQLCNGDDFGLSQPTISRIITQTVDALTVPRMIQRFVKFPTNPVEIQRIQADFSQIAGFPGVVGVIDGTHIKIVAPKDFEEVYINRKNFHSINVQVVFDANYLVRNIVAKWPGSVHDSRILRESGVWRGFEQNRVPAGCYLLGDSGYPCKRWLLTPYLRPEGQHQEAYNRAHKKTRSVVERGIGQLKRRFQVLHGEIRVNPQKAAKIIMACGIMHNICKERNIPIEDENEHEEDVDDHNRDEVFQPAQGEPVPDGALFRENILETTS
ncbi:putative nuclease HARBI1 [Macrobrachium rosenbergii]|uniref:putative nuclease HARBI1 n=1 Tax=Macrobrachium rosenbergii TaxID=79674 RepID=UPI0034D41BC5